MKNDIYVQVADYLLKYCKGLENASHSNILQKKFGISAREVRRIVNELRINGMPICSGQSGYWWAGSEVELVSTIKALEASANSILDAVAGLQRFGGLL